MNRMSSSFLLASAEAGLQGLEPAKFFLSFGEIKSSSVLSNGPNVLEGCSKSIETGLSSLTLVLEKEVGEDSLAGRAEEEEEGMDFSGEGEAASERTVGTDRTADVFFFVAIGVVDFDVVVLFVFVFVSLVPAVLLVSKFDFSSTLNDKKSAPSAVVVVLGSVPSRRFLGGLFLRCSLRTFLECAGSKNSVGVLELLLKRLGRLESSMLVEAAAAAAVAAAAAATTSVFFSKFLLSSVGSIEVALVRRTGGATINGVIISMGAAAPDENARKREFGLSE